MVNLPIKRMSCFQVHLKIKRKEFKTKKNIEINFALSLLEIISQIL